MCTNKGMSWKTDLVFSEHFDTAFWSAAATSSSKQAGLLIGHKDIKEDEKIYERASLLAETWPEKSIDPKTEKLTVLGAGGFGIVFMRYRGAERFALKYFYPTKLDFDGNEIAPTAKEIAHDELTMLLYLKEISKPACRADIICYSQHFQAVPGEEMKQFLMQQPKKVLLPSVVDWEKKLSYFIETKYYDGSTMADFLRDSPTLIPKIDRQRRLSIVKTAIGALAFMHQHNTVHRDLKPENIIIYNFNTKSPQSVLLDVGFGCEVKFCVYQAGNLQYIAPELFAIYNATAKIPTRATLLAADVYSLGATLYDFLTGAETQNHSDRTPDKIRIPLNKGFSEIIEKMIEYNPAQRITAEKAYEKIKNMK